MNLVSVIHPLGVVIALVAVLFGQAQPPKRAGGTEELLLAGNRLVLPAPRGYELLSRDTQWTALSFRSRASAGNEAGAVLASLSIQAQRGLVTSPAVRQRLLDSMLDELRAEGRAMGAEVLVPAAVADDPDLFARVTDTVRSGGKTLARSRSVRLISGQLVGLYVVAGNADEAKRKSMLASAESELLKRVVPARVPGAGRVAQGPSRDRVLTLKGTRVAIVVPEGYRAEPVGEAAGSPAPRPGAAVTAGVVAVLTTEAFAERRIVVTVVPVEVPAGQVVNAEVLGVAADRAIELETERLALPQPLGEWERAVDSRFLRRQRRLAGDDLNRFASDSRQVRMGNLVMSVAMACPEDEEEETALAADAVAEGLKSAN